MKNILFFLIITLLILPGCAEKQIQQGEIEYEITYPYSELSGIMDVMLPKKMVVKFKGDKMIVSIEKGSIFQTDIISEELSKKLAMRLDFGSEKIIATLNDEDLGTLTNTQPKYTSIKSDRIDTVAGITANFYEITAVNEKVGTFEAAFSNNLSINNTEWFTSYAGTFGIPLIYILERYGIIMQLRAVKFRSIEIEDSEFDTSNKFKTVSYTKYEKKINELFQLILEE